MKKNKRKIIVTFLVTFIVMMFWSISAYAAPTTTDIPQLNISFGNGTDTPKDYVNKIGRASCRERV